MAINLNSELLSGLPEPLALAERALFYGDALFETVRVFQGKMPFWEDHWKRLYAGLMFAGFKMPGHWNAAFFEKEILRIAPVNARVRLTVWRSPGGLYAPENPQPLFLITAAAVAQERWEWMSEGPEVGVSQKVRLPIDAGSNLKTLNAPRYVVAAAEAADQGWDDALILNTADRVCEATSSNLFWWESGQLCTVPLSEGCVAGVMRNFVLETARAERQTVLEKTATLPTLARASEIFLTNAIRGIVPVRIFVGRSLPARQTRHLFDLITDRMSRIV